MPNTPDSTAERSAPPGRALPGHWRWLAVAAVALLAMAGAWQLALWQLKGAVLQALGPGAQVGALRVGLTGVQIGQLRITRPATGPGSPPDNAAHTARAAPWPAADELRADQVHLVPDWRSLWSGPRHGQWRLQTLRVRGDQLSMLRGAHGCIRPLPSLLEAAAGTATARAASASVSAASAPPGVARHRLRLGQLQLEDTVVELFDAAVRRPAHRLRLEGLSVQAGPLALPHAAADAPTRLQLQATLKGPRHDGRMSLQGQVHLGTHDADLQARLQGVDMLALQPYLLKAGEGRIRGGQLDLTLDPQVQQQRLQAPGVLTLTGLDLAPGSGLGGLLTGVSRQAVLAALERDGRITLRFSLDGRLDDPAFSIQENLAQRISGALAETVGVSLSGVVDGVGGLLKGLLGR